MESLDAPRRNRGRQLLRLWLRGVTELLLYAPVWLIPAVYGIGTFGGQLLWLLHLPLLTLAGAALAHPIRRTWLRWAAAAAAGAAYALLPLDWWQRALLAAAGCAAAWRGMAVTAEKSREADSRRCGFGVVSYALAGMICSRLPEWSVYMPWLTAAGIGSLAIALFTWNRQLLQLETKSAEERPVPAAVRRHNRFMVAAVFALAVGVTALASGAIGRLLWSLLRAAIGLLASPPSAPPAPPPPKLAARQQQLPPPADEAGWFQRLLDLLFYTMTAVVIAVGVYLLVRFMYRHRREWIRYFTRLLSRIAALLSRKSRIAEETGYVDEEKGLWSWELVENAVKRRWLRRFGGERSRSDVRWNGLSDNRERVRQLYRQWLGRLQGVGYAVPRHLTPDEIRRDAESWTSSLPQARRRRSVSVGGEDTAALLELYYKARYSEGEIADDELERLGRRQERH